MDALNSADPASLEIAPDSPRRFINRELSWLAFNSRVLEESDQQAPSAAGAGAVPFDLRCEPRRVLHGARRRTRRQVLQTRSSLLSDDGMTPVEATLGDHATARSTLMGHQQDALARCFRTICAQAGIAVLDADELTETERSWLDTYFIDQVFPILTPWQSIRRIHFRSFPMADFRRSWQAAAPRRRRPLMALLPLPQQVGRFVRLPGPDIRFLPLET
jgi:polyphosphate kinase